MMARCYTKTNLGYRHYGAVGIIVCERWHTFENFRADMGDRPFPRATLDRIDGAGVYEPSNCRWATYLQQSVNRRTMPVIWSLDGGRITIGQMAEGLAMTRRVLREHLRTSGILTGRYCGSTTIKEPA